jgi:putative transposase
MSRPLRIQYPGAYYHVMNRGVSRRNIFLEKSDYEEFLKTVSEIHELWRVEVFAYCLMENHYHLCMMTPEGNLSRAMRHLNGLYTQRFNKAHSSDGPIFRGRYKAIVVDADEYLTQVVRYIHLNPVEARLVREPEDYAWSSHSAYLHPKEAPKWLNLMEVLEGFGNIKEFHRFVVSGSEDSLKGYYNRERKIPILGDAGFRERLQGISGSISREHPREQRTGPSTRLRTGSRPSVDKVVNMVAEAYGIKLEEVVNGRRGRNNESRKVGMYLVRRLCDLSLKEVAERFGVSSYGVVGWAYHEVRAKMGSDKAFRKRVERIAEIISQQKS